MTNEGCGVIFWDGNSLETSIPIARHTRVGKWDFFASAATVRGNVTMGDRNFIGANAAMTGNAVFGSEVLASAGEVIKNAENQGIYLPARTAK